MEDHKFYNLAEIAAKWWLKNNSKPLADDQSVKFKKSMIAVILDRIDNKIKHVLQFPSYYRDGDFGGVYLKCEYKLCMEIQEAIAEAGLKLWHVSFPSEVRMVIEFNYIAVSIGDRLNREIIWEKE